MKVGNVVKHKKTGNIGIIHEFMKKNNGALVDFSDKTGVMFRWVNINDLEIINENIK